jgi:hypothetical protein
MRLPILFAVLVGIAVMSTSCKHAPAMQTKSDWLYLGIPVDEEYPDTQFHLDHYVPQDKYWRVSRVRHVSRDEYERDVAAGHVLFRDDLAGAVFYSTELRSDFLRHGDMRYLVTTLERKAYP